MNIEVMDTTLRDGEQTPRLAFTDVEKLNIAKILLDEVKVDRIEVASAKVSQGELKAVQKITDWCRENGIEEKIEVLGFVDNKSVDWIVESGAKVMNLLCKGSLNHVENQLKKQPQEHLDDIKKIVLYAQENGLSVNLYLEDWSSGMVNSQDYVFFLINNLKDLPIKRFMLPDTLGILNPLQVKKYCELVVTEFPDLHFDFHAHNDYDIAVANAFMAIVAGIKGIHTTINGLGERAGNTPLASIAGVINDMVDGAKINIREDKLNKASKMVEAFSGIRIPPNKPIVGENVFTQTCGVHADGDSKGNLYFNQLIPERFGRFRKYALGKTSGKASITKNLEELGISLDNQDVLKVTKRVVELGDKKETITTEDLPFIVADVLGTKYSSEKVVLNNYYVCHANNLLPVATVKIEFGGKLYEETSTGDGQYDSFMKAIEKIYQKLNKQLPALIDYIVTIPPGGKTNALVETVITWQNSREFKTTGLDSDQTASAIKATMKMLNLIEQEHN